MQEALRTWEKIAIGKKKFKVDFTMFCKIPRFFSLIDPSFWQESYHQGEVFFVSLLNLIETVKTLHTKKQSVIIIEKMYKMSSTIFQQVDFSYDWQIPDRSKPAVKSFPAALNTTARHSSLSARESKHSLISLGT